MISWMNHQICQSTELELQVKVMGYFLKALPEYGRLQNLNAVWEVISVVDQPIFAEHWSFIDPIWKEEFNKLKPLIAKDFLPVSAPEIPVIANIVSELESLDMDLPDMIGDLWSWPKMQRIYSVITKVSRCHPREIAQHPEVQQWVERAVVRGKSMKSAAKR
jgi:hypothetical protein